MGAPSRQQIDDAIAHGLARGDSDDEIVEDVASLHRMSDEELAEFGVIVPPAQPESEARPAAPDAFASVPVRRRHDGWTAEKQRAFIAALAETGCVSEACAEVGITPRSAYRLREHPKARPFCEAWDHALSMASARLTSIAFERAVHGSVERIYRNGELVEERRKPSDRLLMWLLAHVDPVTFGWLNRAPSGSPHISFYKLQYARKEMPKELRKLSDIDPADCPAEGLIEDDYDFPTPPARA